MVQVNHHTKHGIYHNGHEMSRAVAAYFKVIPRILLEKLTEITKPVMTANKAAEVRTDCLSNTRRGLALHDRNACSAPVLLQLMQLL